MMVHDPAPVLVTMMVPTIVPAAPSDDPEKAVSDWQAVDDAAAVVLVVVDVDVDGATVVVLPFMEIDGLLGDELHAAASSPARSTPVTTTTPRTEFLIR
jgi:hypothetical protein